MASSVVIWLLVGGGIRRAKKADMREASNYTPVATLCVNSVCCSQALTFCRLQCRNMGEAWNSGQKTALMIKISMNSEQSLQQILLGEL